MAPLRLQVLPVNGDEAAVIAALGGLVQAVSRGEPGWLWVELDAPADLDPASLDAIAARLAPVAVRVRLLEEEPTNA